MEVSSYAHLTVMIVVRRKTSYLVCVCVSGQYVYVCNRNHYMSVFTTQQGQYVTSFGQDAKHRRSDWPDRVCVDRDGFIYVLQFFNDKVHVL